MQNSWLVAITLSCEWIYYTSTVHCKGTHWAIARPPLGAMSSEQFCCKRLQHIIKIDSSLTKTPTLPWTQATKSTAKLTVWVSITAHKPEAKPWILTWTCDPRAHDDGTFIAPAVAGRRGFTKFTQLHVVTSQFVMITPCALPARIEDRTESRHDSWR